MAEDEQKSSVPAGEILAQQDEQSVTSAENEPVNVETITVREEKSVTIAEDVNTIRSDKDAIRSDKDTTRTDRDTIRSEKSEMTKSAKEERSIYAPAYPLPPGFGEGTRLIYYQILNIM